MRVASLSLYLLLMNITHNTSISRNDLALVTFGHHVTLQLRAFFANRS